VSSKQSRKEFDMMEEIYYALSDMNMYVSPEAIRAYL